MNIFSNHIKINLNPFVNPADGTNVKRIGVLRSLRMIRRDWHVGVIDEIEGSPVDDIPGIHHEPGRTGSTRFVY